MKYFMKRFKRINIGMYLYYNFLYISVYYIHLYLYILSNYTIYNTIYNNTYFLFKNIFYIHNYFFRFFEVFQVFYPSDSSNINDYHLTKNRILRIILAISKPIKEKK